MFIDKTSAAHPELALDLPDIQGTVLRLRPDRYHGVYILYRIDDADNARKMLAKIVPYVTSAEDWDKPRPHTLNVVLTWQGLKALGLPQTSLDSFPEEFRMGMAERKDVLGDLGPNDPENWITPLGGKDVHIGIVISARTQEELEGPVDLAMNSHAGLTGVTAIYRLDAGIPETGREHFGFRDGIGSAHVIGSGSTAYPGQDAIMPGEFILGYEDESAIVAAMPQPEVLGRNGTFLAFRQLHSDAAAFRRYLRESARDRDDEELLAAKMVGRWRSGAPLVLAPEKDDPELALDPNRNNDFSYAESDPKGLACPLGSHIRRCNPRDGLVDSITNVKRHRLVRRGMAYGPALPEGVLDDDGVERGIVFIFMGASLTRQFEFIQQVWINEGDFVGLSVEKDPLAGTNDGQGIHTVPAKPLRRRLTSLPRFVTVRGGEYCFLPSISALNWLATSGTTNSPYHHEDKETNR